MRLFNTLLNNSFWLFSSQIGSMFIAYLLIILITRELGAVGLGQYSFIISLVSFSFMFCNFGLSSLVVRDISRNKKLAHKYIPNILGLNIFLGSAAVILTTIIIFLANKPEIVITSTLIYAFTSLIILFGDPYLYLLQAHEKMQYVGIAELFQKLTLIFVAGFFLLNGYNLIWLFIAVFFSFILRALFLIYHGTKIEKFRFEFNFKYWFFLIKKGLPFLLSGLAIFIYFRIDTIMLSFIVGDQATGWYNAAYKFIELFMFIPAVISIVLLPSMSKLYKQDIDRLKLLVKTAYRYLFILALPICFGTFFISDRLIGFIYGADFLPHAGIALKILIWAELFIFFNLSLGNILNAIDKQKLFTLVTGICAVLNVILNLILIPKYSYVGAGIATIATQFVCMALLFYYVKKNLMKAVFNKLWKILLSVTVMLLIISQILFLHVLFIIIIAIIVYFSTIYLLGLEEIDKDILKQVVGGLR